MSFILSPTKIISEHVLCNTDGKNESSVSFVYIWPFSSRWKALVSVYYIFLVKFIHLTFILELSSRLLLCISPISYWIGSVCCWILPLSIFGVLSCFEISFLAQKTEKCWSILKADGCLCHALWSSVKLISHCCLSVGKITVERSCVCVWRGKMQYMGGKRWRNAGCSYITVINWDGLSSCWAFLGFAGFLHLEARLSMLTFLGFTRCTGRYQPFLGSELNRAQSIVAKSFHCIPVWCWALAALDSSSGWLVWIWDGDVHAFSETTWRYLENALFHCVICGFAITIKYNKRQMASEVILENNYRMLELEETFRDCLFQLPSHFRANQKLSCWEHFPATIPFASRVSLLVIRASLVIWPDPSLQMGALWSTDIRRQAGLLPTVNL